MSEMIERVARALALHHGYNPDQVGASIDGIGRYHKPAWRVWEDDAHAAIAAMREPTPAMVANGYRPASIWRDMIDEALR